VPCALCHKPIEAGQGRIDDIRGGPFHNPCHETFKVYQEATHQADYSISGAGRSIIVWPHRHRGGKE
jgi:hypothetical protein